MATFKIVRREVVTTRHKDGDAWFESSHVKWFEDKAGDYVEKTYTDEECKKFGCLGVKSYRHVLDCNPNAVAKLRA